MTGKTKTNNAITKKQFESLFSDDITKKEYNHIINLIDHRFSEICDKFLIKTHPDGPGYSWYDYDNGHYREADGPEGYFDPHRYIDSIGIIGEYIEAPEGYELYSGFPLRWLWKEDWEEERKATTEDYLKEKADKKAKAKKRREARKKEKAKLRASIEKKLTKEELKIIKFK